MPGDAVIFPSPPPAELLTILEDHLPWSLTLLRRLQFTKYPGGTSKDARIVLSSDVGGIGDTETRPRVFTVAYLDFSRGPDTQMYLYSTLQDGNLADSTQVYERQLFHLWKAVVDTRKSYGREISYPGHILLGGLDSRVRSLLIGLGHIEPRPSGDYDKWLIRLEDLPSDDGSLPEGMEWGQGTLDDCHLVVSRSDVPRQAKLLVTWPNVFIKLKDGTPVAWAFLGVDASLSSLACEEPYRRKGLSKKLAAKVFREHMNQYGNDGLCSADVSAHNIASRSVCASLGGKPSWEVSWVLMNVEETAISGTSS